MVRVEPKERPDIDAVASAALLARTSTSLLSSDGLDGLVLNDEEEDCRDEGGEEEGCQSAESFLFSQLFLCLSQPCLGKMLCFVCKRVNRGA